MPRLCNEGDVTPADADAVHKDTQPDRLRRQAVLAARCAISDEARRMKRMVRARGLEWHRLRILALEFFGAPVTGGCRASLGHRLGNAGTKADDKTGQKKSR